MDYTAWKKLEVFLEFLFFGVLLGLVENIIAIQAATSHNIDFRSIIISLLVVIPFAAIGELIVDRKDLIPKPKSKWLKHLEVFLEFLIFGIFMGVIEDLIVIGFATGEPITMQTVLIVALVTTPFAILGEIIVDKRDWLLLERKVEHELEKEINKVETKFK